MVCLNTRPLSCLSVAVATVIRRRYDVTSADEEVEYPDAANSEAVARAHARYDALVSFVDQLDPDALPDALAARMDLDGYLRWMAINTSLQNGDDIDVAFFYASPDSADVDAPWFFRHLGRAPDDLFSDCHAGGQHALDRSPRHPLLHRVRLRAAASSRHQRSTTASSTRWMLSSSTGSLPLSCARRWTASPMTSSAR